MTSWADHANSVIRKAVDELSSEIQDADELFKKISKEYYPYGERRYWPYKAWLGAIKKQKAAYNLRQRNKIQAPVDNRVGMFAEDGISEPSRSI